MSRRAVVDFVDINGDKLQDLITADAAGYLRAYINVGTKTEPEFDHAGSSPLYPADCQRQPLHRGLWRNPWSVRRST